MEEIPFNRSYVTGRETDYIKQAIDQRTMCGNGPFFEACQGWLQKNLHVTKAFLTPSCTAALEMSALLLDLKPGDEVIMPSFTFVSTANAVCLRGATPVFVDIRPDTLNLDEKLIEQAITSKTKAICPMHYAGVSCQMDRIMQVAEAYNLFVYEDAAQALGAKFMGKPVGSLGDLASFSFHETKNITCGEGGALVMKGPRWVERAEIIWEKGTNRINFLLGRVDKYSWVDVGSSFLPSEMTAGFLLAQLEAEADIRRQRLAIWNTYHQGLAELEQREYLRRPVVPADCEHPAHLYYVLLPSEKIRNQLMQALREKGIGTVHHYVSLHSSKAGVRYSLSRGSMEVTDSLSSRLLRLPLWIGVEQYQNYIMTEVKTALDRILA